MVKRTLVTQAVLAAVVVAVAACGSARRARPARCNERTRAAPASAPSPAASTTGSASPSAASGGVKSILLRQSTARLSRLGHG